ncbi:MAG TPA: NAD(P)H-dependent oxidoreductase subunit E, partial [Acidiphilium sp.]
MDARGTQVNGHSPAELRTFRHPGSGDKRARPTPKGRVVDPDARDEIEALLGDRPLQRDLLIEHLHLIQDRYGQLSAAHLAALADIMRLAMAEVYETATFYAHFDVVKDGDAPVPGVTVRVCDSITCSLFGSEKLLAELKQSFGSDVRVVRAPCVGLCEQAPAVEVGHHFIHRADAETVRQAVKAG